MNPDPTHAPYVNSSHLKSSRYNRGICVLDGKNRCKVPTANASEIAARPTCTPEALKDWDGAGKWYQSEDGHFR